jgi:hypothetical protein
MIITNDNITEATILQEEVINPFGANYLAWNNPNYDEATANEWVTAMKNINLNQEFTVSSINAGVSLFGPSVRQNGNIIGIQSGQTQVIVEINPFLGSVVATYSNPASSFTSGSGEGATLCTFDDRILYMPYNNGSNLQVIGLIDPKTGAGLTYSLGITTGYGFKSAVQRNSNSILIQGYEPSLFIDFNPITLTHTTINSTGQGSGLALAPNGNVYLGPNRSAMDRSVNYITPGNSVVKTGFTFDPSVNYKFASPVFSIKTSKIYCAATNYADPVFLVIDPVTNTSEFIEPTGETLTDAGAWSSKATIEGDIIISTINSGNLLKYNPSTNVLSKLTGYTNNNYSNIVLAGDGRIWSWGQNNANAFVIGSSLQYPLDSWTYMSRMLSLNTGAQD